MIWQDYVLSIGVVGFAIALLPAIRGSQKPPFSSSVLTASIQVVFAGTFISLDLWFSAVASLINGLCWATLAVQVLKKK